MFPLARQVMLVTDFAKGMGARLAGLPIPSYPDEEKTFPELQDRLAKTVHFLSGLTKEQFADAATRTVVIKLGGNEMKFTGADYAATYALPNFYFHLATAYNILRHNGLEIGKADYMGRS